MELILKEDNGTEIKLEKLNSLGEGDVIIKLGAYFKMDEIKHMEKYLSKKFQRKVIALDRRVEDILTIPPQKQPHG